jgi:hypothetical protein
MLTLRSAHGRRARMGTSALMAAALTVLSFATATPANADATDFRVGIQLADHGGTSGFGVERFTGFARFGNSVTPWAGDSNNFDPDAVRVELNISTFILTGLDFRIGGQARDNGSHQGPIVYTAWASEGGGQTDLITDDNVWDPDQYRIFLDVRPMPAGEVITDVRLAVQAYDDKKGFGNPTATPWASQGGGRSALALPLDANDFDAIVIELEVR